MPRTAPKKDTKPLRLDFRSRNPVVVVPENEDRFVTTAREAALACRQAQDAKEWQEEFERFLAHVNRWCGEHADHVDRGYLGFADEGLKVFLVTKASEYCFDLDDAVADLVVELTDLFPRCPTDVMHVPDRREEALHAFFSPHSALQLYGE